MGIYQNPFLVATFVLENHLPNFVVVGVEVWVEPYENLLKSFYSDYLGCGRTVRAKFSGCRGRGLA